MEGNKENKERYGIIYKITNTVNGKCYIGQTTDKRGFNGRYYYSGKGIERVYKYHKSLKEHNSNYNNHLLNSIEKYGFEAFTVDEEFDIAYSKKELDALEKKYIKEFDCINNGYNNTDGGSNGKRSEEACKKMSEKAKERWEDPEERRKISESLKGKNCGENNPNYGKGYKISGENNPMYGVHRYGENNPMYGKHRTEEEKRKMSKKAKERWNDSEERRKQSERIKGRFTGENHPRSRKVICLNDSKIFNIGKECAEYYKKDITTIRSVCKHRRKQTKDGLVFMYYDEYLQQQEQTA